jgi:hypothetical protein
MFAVVVAVGTGSVGMRTRRRRVEMLAVMPTEFRLELGDLGELVRGELAAQGIDRFQQILRALGMGNGVVGETLGKCKGLRLVVGALRGSGRRRGTLRGCEQGVGEIAPGVELIGADADLGLYRAQLLCQAVRTVMPALAIMLEALTIALGVASPHHAVMPVPWRRVTVAAGAIAGARPGGLHRSIAAAIAPCRGEQRQTCQAEDSHDKDRGNP